VVKALSGLSIVAYGFIYKPKCNKKEKIFKEYVI